MKMFGNIFGGKKKDKAPEPAPAPAPAPVQQPQVKSASIPIAPSRSASINKAKADHVAVVPAPAPVEKPVTVTVPVPKPAKSPRADATKSIVPPIDWKEALLQVGNDRDFLTEVLGDLKDEAKTAQDDIRKAIGDNNTPMNYGDVMRAAHRIKGSASYLSCGPLKDISYELQQLGHRGEELQGQKDEESIKALTDVTQKIKDSFAIFEKDLEELQKAIADGVPP